MQQPLPAHYILAGVVLNVAQGLLYGVLLGTMAVPGRFYATARIFVLAPWCLKCLFGWISDCFPINGYHRKFYSAYGWLTSAVAHMLLAVASEEPTIPKYCKDIGYGDLGNFVPEAGVCNPEADQGAHTSPCCWHSAYWEPPLQKRSGWSHNGMCSSHGKESEARRILMQSMALRLGGSLGSCFLAFCFNSQTSRLV